MGHRANFILIQEGQTFCFTDRWSGINIPNLTFWGEHLTLQHLDVQHAVVPEFLRDSLWCEGGFLLNRDQKALVFHFDYWSVDAEPLVDLNGKMYHWDIFTEFPLLVRCYLDMVRACWPGWTIKFAQTVDFCCPQGFEFDVEKIPEKEMEVTAEQVLDFPLGKTEIYLKFAELLLMDQRFDFRMVAQQVLQTHPQAELAVDYFKAPSQIPGMRDREEIMRQVLRVVLED
ncbi:hypothetical protein [Deinococcus cellulosilyticus]|uniref:Uncharacterized protein n=1 Tax=Deinococcus cellulosilyticus (strain DSM 18568 / NBRC 106333 / KACC 11606 / 5516J-15) TaxID=1223518 RepID=A0A511MZM5_DEIC1|nr:hypothetical protein [Deinococcus cellulosilyticus]GEM45771.1 hypothetical protein DC3_14060 [Deinococcus cellulosilyticus NBRC 106333 = KACC 11606]